MNYNGSAATQVSDVGDVGEGQSLAKNNTRGAVTSHDSKEVEEVKRVHQK